MPLESPYRNPGRWRAVIYANEVRHGTAGCLLSLVLLAPLFVKQFGFAMVTLFVMLYSLLVVPALANFYSVPKLIVKLARGIWNVIPTFGQVSTNSSRNILRCNFLKWCFCPTTSLIRCIYILYIILYEGFMWLNSTYVSFTGFRTTINQIVFLVLCQKYFLLENRATSLYSLLFYSVLAYLHRSLVTRRWGSDVFYNTSVRDYLKLTAWFVVLRLGKGVAMAFVLIIFTTHVDDLEISIHYTCLTFAYFILTQKRWTGKENFITYLKRFELDSLDEEEEFWIPFCIQAVPVAASIVPMTLLVQEENVLCFIAMYTNITVPYLILREEFGERQRNSVCLFKRVSSKEHGLPGSCPVCLDVMRVCRVTPCGHAFHTICLKRWVAVSPLCPLCKQSLKNKS